MEINISNNTCRFSMINTKIKLWQIPIASFSSFSGHSRNAILQACWNALKSVSRSDRTRPSLAMTLHEHLNQRWYVCSRPLTWHWNNYIRPFNRLFSLFESLNPQAIAVSKYWKKHSLSNENQRVFNFNKNFGEIQVQYIVHTKNVVQKVQFC